MARAVESAPECSLENGHLFLNYQDPAWNAWAKPLTGFEQMQRLEAAAKQVGIEATACHRRQSQQVDPPPLDSRRHRDLFFDAIGTGRRRYPARSVTTALLFAMGSSQETVVHS
jgi:hypothetical protein